MTSSWSHSAFGAVVQLVGARTGLSFGSARMPDTEAAIRCAMARAGETDVSSYAELVRAGWIPLDDLVTELTVGETYFFRHPDHFEFIRTRVFRDAIERRGADHVLRVWSAGCATGEEPYSLAIALQEAGLRGQVLASDLSQAALTRAREAVYRPWALRGLDEARIQRWFRQAGDRWSLHPSFVDSVAFRCHNLAQDAYPSLPAGIWGMDLILCRNVLIYFDRASIARVARGLHASLADGGWLITGPSDPPLNSEAPLVPVVTSAGVFYRKADGTPHAAMPIIEDERDRRSVDTIRVERQPPIHADARSAAQPVADARPASRAASKVDPLADARQALAAGDDERVLLPAPVEDQTAAVLRLRKLANARGAEETLRGARRALERHPLSTELHLLHALLLLDLKRHAEAEQALRRVLYLDRSLAIASYLLGSALREQGKADAARRAYRNARDLARARPPDDVLPLADGERASGLARLAEAELAILELEKAS